MQSSHLEPRSARQAKNAIILPFFFGCGFIAFGLFVLGVTFFTALRIEIGGVLLGIGYKLIASVYKTYKEGAR